MYETRDLGFKWPYWHTLVFSDEITIDMRCVCPKDVKQMLVQRARSVYWKKWSAEHEQEELKEGVWIDPAPVLLRKKAKGVCGLRGIVMWTRKIFLQGGWTQKRQFDNGCSDVSQCQAFQMDGRHREGQALPLSRMACSKA